MTLVVAFLSGLLFAVGLVLAGMTEPARVLGFLDVAGDWDPTLMFVMGGAIAVFAPLYRLAMRRERPWLGASFQLPTRTRIDARLLVGAGLFGCGWGLSGFCPGPAVVAAGTLSQGALLFVLAMLVGMLCFRGFARLRSRSAPSGERAKTSSAATRESLH